MAIELNDNIKVLAPKPIDSRYFKPNNVPWVSVSEVNLTIPSVERHQGLTVNIAGVEYWYKNGINNLDLETKNVSSGTVTLVTGTNGVTVATGTTTPVIGLGNITPLSTNGVLAATMAFVDATSSIQNQLNLKAPINNPTFTGTVSGVTSTMVGLGLVDNTSDLNKPISNATQTALNLKANDNAVVHLAGTETITGLKTFKGTTASDSAQLGPELATTASGFTWSGSDFATGYSHSPGNTNVLTSVLSANSGTSYQIAYTITGRTAGTVTIDFGGVFTILSMPTGTPSPINGAISLKPTNNAVLTITPESAFDGTIILSVKVITANSVATTTFFNSSGATSNELRASSVTSNFFMGVGAGKRNTTGANNTAIGSNAFIENITGAENTSVGYNALSANVTASNNTAIGSSVLTVSKGRNNTGVGSGTLGANSLGVNNTAIGVFALAANTTGGYNVAMGVNAFQNNTIGSDNTVLGTSAGKFISGGVTPLTRIDKSVLIGSNAMPLGNNQTNQVVIGGEGGGANDGAIGLGSNTTVIGIPFTKGNLIHGTRFINQPAPTPRGSGPLTVANLLDNIVVISGTIAIALSLPTGTDTDAGVIAGALPINNGFDWSIINIGTSLAAITLSAGTDHTYVGNTGIPIATSALFRTVKTATNTFVTYRIG